MRILIAFGTRPEIIKLGPVYRALRQPNVTLDVFWSGQHTELAKGLLDLFEIPAPDNRGAVVDEPGMAGKFGLVMQHIERQLRRQPYDWIVVQGDTATAAAAAAAGFLNHVPVAHVEAGLRTGNLHSPWPEEFNRRIIALGATMHFAPTTASAANLLREGIEPTHIRMVGNTVVDALLYTRSKVSTNYTPIDPAVAALAPDKKLVLATMHRRENIGDNMRQVLLALRELSFDGDKVIALPVHLNPQVRTEVLRVLDGVPNIHLLDPLQYPDFVYLLSRAWVVVSDSGGVQEEAPTFGLQILITRDTTERPEVIEAGFGRLVGSDYTAIVNEVRSLTLGSRPQILAARNPFGHGDSAEQIAWWLVHGRDQQLAAAE